MVSLMRSVIDEGTARGAIAGKLHRPAAGKTGTSNGQRDAWFVGFTPDLLAAVWVGFDDMKKLGRGEAGGKTAAPIWADFMLKAHRRQADQGLRAAAPAWSFSASTRPAAFWRRRGKRPERWTRSSWTARRRRNTPPPPGKRPTPTSCCCSSERVRYSRMGVALRAALPSLT